MFMIAINPLFHARYLSYQFLIAMFNSRRVRRQRERLPPRFESGNSRACATAAGRCS